MKTNHFLITAGILLASALTFSCSSNGSENELITSFACLSKGISCTETSIPNVYNTKDLKESCEKGGAEALDKCPRENVKLECSGKSGILEYKTFFYTEIIDNCKDFGLQ